MGTIGEQKVNWGKDGEKPKEKATEEIVDNTPSKETLSAIAKYKKLIEKDLAATIASANALYLLEPTNVLSSINISLSLLKIELNKIK